MGGFDTGLGRPVTQNVVAPLQAHEMEHIRKVYDEDSAGKKFASIVSPREDAQMFRNQDKHAVPCECIVELYELLWRWGHRGRFSSFAQNFGFAIPDTVVIVKGKPYAWYFISKKDGALLRKSVQGLTLGAVEKKFCSKDKEPDGESGQGPPPICAVWLPMASQFPEARCHSSHADFLSVGACRGLLAGMKMTHSGILQAFVEPHGVSNFLVRTVQFCNQTSLCTRTNRSLLTATKGNIFDRCATFEGWEGLSSSSSRYRSHKHTHMEDLILAAGEMLNARIEKEQVRRMLFMSPSQHVALHFKVTKDHCLFFSFASIVSEKEVILQCRPQLLMGDQCMTEALPGSALLPGGTDRKANPYELPAFSQQLMDHDASLATDEGSAEGENSGSLPPIRRNRGQQSGQESPRRVEKRRPLSERRHQANSQSTALPRMDYTRPEIPEAPFKFQQSGLHESMRSSDYVPYLSLDGNNLKRPLISTLSSRSENPSGRPPLATARSSDLQRPASDPSPPAQPPTSNEFPADLGGNTWGGEPFA